MAEEMENNPVFGKMLHHFSHMVQPKSAKQSLKMQTTIKEAAHNYGDIKKQNKELSSRMNKLEAIVLEMAGNIKKISKDIKKMSK